MLADALTKVVMLDPGQSTTLLQRLSAAALIFDSKGSVLYTPNWHETLKALARLKHAIRYQEFQRG